MKKEYDQVGSRFFETLFLEEAHEFLMSMPKGMRVKVLLKIALAERVKDATLFKKLRDEIWEFRIRFGNQRIRILAFWDKRQPAKTLVLATQGFIKKVDRVPDNEIVKAVRLRRIYFEQTHNN